MLSLPKVIDIELELTTLCNAQCQLCYRNYTTFAEHYPENKVRPIREVIAQLETFPDLEWVRLVGTISEPTLYKDFFELVQYIKSRNIKIEPSTIKCDTCNDDRLLHEGDLLRCYVCHTINRIPYPVNRNLNA